ncbi:hypothetical protein JN01_0006 [Entomoplasma freundtii]|uniref:Uncharacterized protein n=1 Tax=Entomoplasma freundtii TaxID=74700 RepID=A0A2K8NQH0_9MOLU|nr:hypothetical protein EFREU_v1c00420 [Entomoplasma freundtii]TDY58062.1 hypothetical protein JN01_0006 [Entomoplasma freundtii]
MQSRKKDNLEYKSRNGYKKEMALAIFFLNQLRKNIKTSDSEKITFQTHFIGSKKTNLIAVNPEDKHFDFDINLCLDLAITKEKGINKIFILNLDSLHNLLQPYPFSAQNEWQQN